MQPREPERSLTLSCALNNYLSYKEARGDSAAHCKECRRVVSILVERVGDIPVECVDPTELRDFLADVRQRPGRRGRASAHTVKAYHRTLAAFFRYAYDEGWVRPNPMAKVPKPKMPQELVRPFSEDQLRKLLATPNVARFSGLRDVTLMCLLLDTGVRISEVLGARLEDIDLERRLLRVMGKGKRERQVPFGEKSAEWIEQYLARRRKSVVSDYLFVNQFGERLRRESVTQRFTAYGKKAGIEGVRVSPHTFRHTFGVNWLVGEGEFKGDTLSLQRILGHSTPAMTQKYVNFANEDLRKLHARLSPADRIAESPPDGRRRKLK